MENDKLRLVLSPKDGVISQAFAKDYVMGKDKIVQLIPEKANLGTIEIEGTDLTNLIYFKEVTKTSVKFYLKDVNDQIILAKEYRLTDNYQVDFNLYFTSANYKHDYVIKVPGIADTENLSYREKHPDKYFKTKAIDYKLIALDTNEIFKETLVKLAKLGPNEFEKSSTDNVKWVAARSKYFVISLFADKIEADKKFVGKMENNSPAFDLIVEDSDFQNEYEEYCFYLGPVEKDYIEAYDSALIFDRVLNEAGHGYIGFRKYSKS